MNTLMSKITDYLVEFYKNNSIKYNSRNKGYICPKCKHEAHTAIIIPNSFILRCNEVNCNYSGSVIDVVRVCEPEKSHWDDSTISNYISDKYGIQKVDVNTTAYLFELYEKNGFDLVPLAANGKIPVEKEWTKKTHKDKTEWENWLLDNLNFGLKTGKCSGITCIDIDVPEIPEELQHLIGDDLTLFQTTNKGMHFIYKYDPDLPKTRICDLKIDIENDGGQIVVPPSTVDGRLRGWELYDIKPIPPALKKYLLEKIKGNKLNGIDSTVLPIKTIEPDLVSFGEVPDGERHHNFMKFGGILRKQMPLTQVAYTLSMINKYICNPPLTPTELNNVVKSIDKYANIDEKDLAVSILDYVIKVEEATGRDIQEALSLKKDKCDLAIAYLVREGYLIKKGRNYKAIRKMPWQDTFMEDGKTLGYQVPFFDDVAVIRHGDLIVVGAKTGVGKTHIAVSMIKNLVKQNIKPNYVGLESGARFTTIAKKIGLVEGDFNWTINFSPETIELDDNAFTIIDWLLPSDYAQTDKIYQHLAEQLAKHKGVLVVFVQLKSDGTFFAANMLEMFPALVTKFFYEDEQGINSYFEFTKIREAKRQGSNRFAKLLTKYDWNSKEVTLRNIDTEQKQNESKLESFNPPEQDEVL